jgi:hypothetical protein
MAEFGSVALFVWHVRFASTATVDHFILIELVCGVAIILDCWLLLILFERIRSNNRIDILLWFALVVSAFVFPVIYIVGTSPTDSPFLSATSQKLAIFAVLPVAAWLVKSLWKQPEPNSRNLTAP